MPDDKDTAQELLKNLPVKAGQKYRHFKGTDYEVMAVAIKEDTLEPLVVYRSFAKNSIWARTLENFTEYVERDGKKLKRFDLMTN